MTHLHRHSRARGLEACAEVLLRHLRHVRAWLRIARRSRVSHA